jgi:Tol biopolymer transport system component
VTNDDRSLERAARTWLEAGPTRAPDRAVEGALHRIQTTPQERDLRIPWRLPNMFNNRLAVVAAAVLVVVAGAFTFSRLTANLGPAAGASPSPTITQGPASPSIGTSAGRDILFCSSRDTNGGTDEIYAMHADGSDVRRLTTVVAAEDWMPVLSPDGTKIAFGSDRPLRERQAIYVMNVDGSGQVQLTHNEFNSYRPTWSPDGQKIAFGGDDTSDLYVIQADGSGQVRLTTSGKDGHPAWSPDGQRIAFQRFVTALNTDIYLMNADGSRQTQLTHDAEPNEYVTWSPDGTQLAFDSLRAGNQDIYVVNADGTGERRLTTDPANEYWPAWSPDGREIAYARGPASTTSDIYVMNADGSGQVNITNNAAGNWCPAWR